MFPKTPPCIISEDTTESDQYSASKSDVLEDYPYNICQKSQGRDKFIQKQLWLKASSPIWKK